MGSQAIQVFCKFAMPMSLSRCRRFIDDNCIDCKLLQWRCFSGGRSGGSRWDWDGNGNGTANPNRRSRFSDAYAKNEWDEENEFGFRNAPKQRVWWSEEVDDDDDDDADGGFGILEASIGFGWVLKIFRAFGWMIPAVGISLLMGTGPNAIIMALALPLAQSAFSLAADTLWGRADETPRPKAKRSKRRPATRAPGRARVRREKETQTQMRNEAGNYKSWFEGNNASSKNYSQNCSDFGGWDDLDNPVKEYKDPRVAPIKQEEEIRAQEMLKLSRRAKGDTPLFMRLLVAVFPFLGFWTKFF